MYAWLWRHLPGRRTSWKLLSASLLAVAAVALLFGLVFPWASQHVPFLRVTVEETTSGAGAASCTQCHQAAQHLR